ncbi:MAG TPA: MmgE/PrpD family protein [Stellaceae bacterium]|nr:MmgE/PrpD family protein [Stellaceae bacterium]
MDVTKRLADWAAEWDGTASETARRWARDAIYDTIACMVAGAGDEGASRVRSAISGWGGGAATVVGSPEPASAPWAALANGTAAHALDYDDNIHYAMTHPSAVILPALLALAEEIDAGGADIITAWLVAIEIQVAVGHGVNRLHYDNGWHATSTVGTIGAAAGCARLLGLDREQTAHAISLGVSMASGVKAQFGTAAKPFHAGMAAKNAVIAARLAESGITAAPEPLDGHYGFRSLYVGPASRGWEGVLDDLGAPLAAEKYGLEPKCYPCCAGAHRALDGLLELQAKHKFSAKDVEAVNTLVGWGNASSLLYPDPVQEMEARFSMQYCIAAALTGGQLQLSDFILSAIQRPEVRRLFPLITMETHPRGDAEAPEARKPAEITVRLKDGRVLHTKIQHARGTMFRPFSRAELEEKFRDCAEGLMPPAGYAEIRAQLPAIEGLNSVRGLMRHLRFAAGADRGERFARRPYPASA